VSDDVEYEKWLIVTIIAFSLMQLIGLIHEYIPTIWFILYIMIIILYFFYSRHLLKEKEKRLIRKWHGERNE